MRTVRTSVALACVVTLFSTSAVCQDVKGTTGPFHDTQAIETLRPGVSTAEDIRKLAGEPTGHGEFVGIVDYTPHQIWFYDDIEVLGATGDQSSKTIRMNVRQQFLMFFVRDGRYQGHMWFSNDTRGTGWIK